jgi:hypothetical protein
MNRWANNCHNKRQNNPTMPDTPNKWKTDGPATNKTKARTEHKHKTDAPQTILAWRRCEIDKSKFASDRARFKKEYLSPHIIKK